MPKEYQLSLLDVMSQKSPSASLPELTKEMKADFITSGKTSIYRSGLSAPAKIIIEKNMLQQGASLNFGKGKHEFDSDGIKQITGNCQNYDYVYHPDINVLGQSYKNVFSSYVVNTLPIKSRAFVYQQMANCTDTSNGVCFIAARTDRIAGLVHEDGVITSKKTYQKSYKKSELQNEASQYFVYVRELKAKAGFSLIACSHAPLPQRVIDHAK